MSDQARPSRSAIAVAAALSLAGGALLDFLLYGTAKIVWAVVYVPLYAVAASVLHTQLSRSRWPRLFRTAFVFFIAGAALARLTLAGRHRHLTYVMTVASLSPATLRLAPRTLALGSGRALAGKAVGAEVPVEIDSVSDYGCLRSFELSAIGGMSIGDDSWTWRDDPDTRGGPGREDDFLPWCRIQPYRAVTPARGR